MSDRPTIESTGHSFSPTDPLPEAPKVETKVPPTHRLVVSTSANEQRTVAEGPFSVLSRIRRLFGGQQTRIEETPEDSSGNT